MATRTKKPTQEELHALVDELVAGGRNRTEAFAHLCTTHGMRAGTIAAAYYRVERAKTRTQRPEEVTVTPAATAPAEPAQEELTQKEEAAGAEEPRRIGQLAFDGFVIKEHKLKIAGTTVQLSDEEVREIKLGSELEFTFTARVVKRNNHLLTDDDGSTVEHDLIAVMEGVTRS